MEGIAFLLSHSAIVNVVLSVVLDLAFMALVVGITVAVWIGARVRQDGLDIAIQLETMEEKPLTAKAVSVTLSDVKSSKRLPTVQAEHGSDDQWHVRIPNLAAGRWMLGLGISISDTDKFSVESPILIR